MAARRSFVDRALPRLIAALGAAVSGRAARGADLARAPRHAGLRGARSDLDDRRRVDRGREHPPRHVRRTLRSQGAVTFAAIGGAVSVGATMLLVPRFGLSGPTLGTAFSCRRGSGRALFAPADHRFRSDASSVSLARPARGRSALAGRSGRALLSLLDLGTMLASPGALPSVARRRTERAPPGGARALAAGGRRSSTPISRVCVRQGERRGGRRRCRRGADVHGPPVEARSPFWARRESRSRCSPRPRSSTCCTPIDSMALAR